MKNYLLIVIAIILDLLIGDPVFSLHPVRLVGKLILKIENQFYNSSLSKKISGFISVLVSLSTVLAVFIILYHILDFVPYGKEVFSIIIFYSTIAIKDLSDHGMRVKRALDKDDIVLARKNAGMILSRDVYELSLEKLIKGTIESMSENSSDSIIAPIFWGLILGPAGALAYRVINTMDAMWGYKNERFIDFGKSAAILDDIVNFLPARLTGGIICLVSGLSKGSSIHTAWRIMVRDHKNTASPNAGYPEAAMAGALGIQLGGEASYFGKIVNKPVIGENINELASEDISKSLRLIAGSVLLFMFVIGIPVFLLQ